MRLQIALLYFISCIMAAEFASDGWKIQPFIFPSSLTVGTRASTLCATTDGTGLQFQWLKNGKRIETSSNIQIRSYSDSSMIVIQPLKEEDSGNYTCIVKSNHLTDSYTAPLVVLIPPNWVQKPVDQDVMAGEMIEIPCKVNGKPDANIQWSLSRTEDSFHANVVSGEKVTIFPNGSLFINAASKSDEGLYKCNASNGVGNPLESTMALKVIGLPKIQPFAFTYQVISGTKTSVTCTAISGSSPMEFKWFKNGHPIKMNHKINVRTYTDFSVIFLEEVDQSSSGNYTCELITPSGTDIYTSFLDVKEPPKWLQQPKDAILNNGENISLECSATGHPLPNVTWKKSSENFQDQLSVVQNQKQMPGKSILEMKHASSTDEGFYICVADNGISTIKTNGIVINVCGLDVFGCCPIIGNNVDRLCTSLVIKWSTNPRCCMGDC